MLRGLVNPGTGSSRGGGEGIKPCLSLDFTYQLRTYGTIQELCVSGAV